MVVSEETVLSARRDDGEIAAVGGGLSFVLSSSVATRQSIPLVDAGRERRRLAAYPVYAQHLLLSLGSALTYLQKKEQSLDQK